MHTRLRWGLGFREQAVGHLGDASRINEAHDSRRVDVELRSDVVSKAIRHRQLRGEGNGKAAP